MIKIAEISHLIPPVLKYVWCISRTKRKSFEKDLWFAIKKMRLMRGYTQTKVAKAISRHFPADSKIRERCKCCKYYE